MHHDRSGAIVRFGIIAALLGAAAWGYMSFADQQQTALAPAPIEEQQVADASGYANSAPSALPAESEATQPTPAPAPAPRRTAPAPAPAEAVPPPSTTSTPPTTPAPIPPLDTPPSG
jgi:hypothetical protein